MRSPSASSPRRAECPGAIGRAVSGCNSGGLTHTEGVVINDLQSDRFAAHVHEVVDLDAHGASPATIEARVGSMTVDREEQSALWLLAFSLRNGAHTHRGVPDPELTHSRR